jgi:beta-alanine--pyruvate transaminase
MNAFWMPFTPNKTFKANPRMFAGAEGMYYITADGRRVLDTIAGLWCVNAGHGQPKIVKAIQEQAARLDFVSSFNMSHPAAFTLANRIAALAPGDLNHVFFCNSGSEAADTALKIARAYHRVRGDGGRTRFIGRAKAYHGVGWGGLSVSGLGHQRRDFTPLLGEVDHLALPYDRAKMGFSKGQPETGGDYAEELAQLLATVHNPATVAAVIVEPVIGSGGVYPPPRGYLERLRQICDANGILLIFDEVITGFGRTGKPFAAQTFGVTPDIMTCAKGMTNGAVPMGATIVND